MSDYVTFRQLDSGISCVEGESALDQWYQSVRDTPINKLDHGTIARALREQLFLEHVVPEAIDRLQEDPLAGDKYEGELLAAIGTIPAHAWTSHKMQAMQTKNIATSIIEHGANKGMLALAQELVDRLSHWEHAEVPTA